eukprot:CAMPEP_0203661362 /NCGR_PEP_ID=MMETSP0088-20131115/59571_1 /ASSEMBLY_ACC=CAM_ASM_001087 /TAXON_ID=426623 /ORGANISM="Chaetoceros affinis, Strain CCMP159" /LENGTH=376 /DNA_ID=CAMNT_0050524031 /DNA_START=60 /DNA_END=1190 /DNA_ORIENTATION=+
MKTVLSLSTTVLLALSHQVYGQGVTITDWMIDMLDEVNAKRATAGTHPLCYNDKVILAAEIHNQDMVNNNFFSHTGSDGSQPWDRLTTQGYTWSGVAENVAFGQFSHTGSDGSQPWDRLTTQGYTWSGVAENIAFGQTTVTQVMNAWMNSPGHRANILNSGYYHFGVAWDTTTNKWTQVFGNSNSESCMTLSTSSPTKKPTKAPTPSTSSPTKKPTKAPTPSTSSPTKKPTKAPTPSTSSPTKKITKAPTPHTKAPIASTLAPVASPVDNCTSLGELKSQMNNMEDKMESMEAKMDNMDGVLMTILDLITQGSTPAPIGPPTPAPVPCVDTAKKVVHNGSKRNWCQMARNANNTNRLCRNNDLYDICPVTCGRCSP